MQSKELTVKCQDGCTAINLVKYSDEEEYFFNFYTSYDSYSSVFKRIKEAWRVLRGVYNEKFDAVLSAADFNKIQQFNKE